MTDNYIYGYQWDDDQWRVADTLEDARHRACFLGNRPHIPKILVVKNNVVIRKQEFIEGKWAATNVVPYKVDVVQRLSGRLLEPVIFSTTCDSLQSSLGPWFISRPTEELKNIVIQFSVLNMI